MAWQTATKSRVDESIQVLEKRKRGAARVLRRGHRPHPCRRIPRQSPNQARPCCNRRGSHSHWRVSCHPTFALRLVAFFARHTHAIPFPLSSSRLAVSSVDTTRPANNPTPARNRKIHHILAHIIHTCAYAPLVRLTRASPRRRYSSPLFTPSPCLGPVPVPVPGLAIPVVRVPVHTHTRTHAVVLGRFRLHSHLWRAPRVPPGHPGSAPSDRTHSTGGQAPASIRLNQPALHYPPPRSHTSKAGPFSTQYPYTSSRQGPRER